MTCRTCGKKRTHADGCPRKPKPCRHCGKPCPGNRLYCGHKCRSLWHHHNGKLPRYQRDARDEPTMAELDALIREQLRPENLPDWWAAAVEEQRNPGIQEVRKPYRRGKVRA